MPMASAHMRRLGLAGGDTAADLQPLQYPALIQLRPAATALAQVDQLFLQCQQAVDPRFDMVDMLVDQRIHVFALVLRAVS